MLLCPERMWSSTWLHCDNPSVLSPLGIARMDSSLPGGPQPPWRAAPDLTDLGSQREWNSFGGRLLHRYSFLKSVRRSFEVMAEMNTAACRTRASDCWPRIVASGIFFRTRAHSNRV